MISRLINRVPARWRTVAKVAALALVAFELWRVALALPLTLPYWRRAFAGLESIAGHSPFAAATGFVIVAVAFTAPMLGVVWGLRKLHRRLSR